MHQSAHKTFFAPCAPQVFRSLWPGQDAPVDRDFLTAILAIDAIKTEKPGKPDFSCCLSYEGGDSECFLLLSRRPCSNFFNYLVYTIKYKCVQSVFEIYKKNKLYKILLKLFTINTEMTGLS